MNLQRNKAYFSDCKPKPLKVLQRSINLARHSNIFCGNSSSTHVQIICEILKKNLECFTIWKFMEKFLSVFSKNSFQIFLWDYFFLQTIFFLNKKLQQDIFDLSKIRLMQIMYAIKNDSFSLISMELFNNPVSYLKIYKTFSICTTIFIAIYVFIVKLW